MLRQCILLPERLRPTLGPLTTIRMASDGKKEAKPGRVICVTSGKGGVGKTTTAANISYGLAEKGFKTVVIDFDIGLRNLDIHLGMERRKWNVI